MIAQKRYARYGEMKKKTNKTVDLSNFNLLLIHTLALISIVTIRARADKITILYTTLTTIHTRDGVTEAGCNSVKKITLTYFFFISKEKSE